MIPRDPADIALESRLLLAAKVIVAPATFDFHDMGFDPALQEVGIVGYEGTGTIGVTKIAKLFELARQSALGRFGKCRGDRS